LIKYKNVATEYIDTMAELGLYLSKYRATMMLIYDELGRNGWESIYDEN
jgi:hypothetical protein